MEITLFDGMTTEELDEAVIQVVLGNVKDDPAFDTIASRLLVKQLYKAVFGDTHDLFGDGAPETIRHLHRTNFASFVTGQVSAGQLDPRLADDFDLDALAAALVPGRDVLLRHIGVQTMRTRYLLTGPHHRPVEVPQFFWMRVAMGLTLSEVDPTARAIELYESMSTLSHLAAGSTLVNPGPGAPSSRTASWHRWRTTSATSPRRSATSCGSPRAPEGSACRSASCAAKDPPPLQQHPLHRAGALHAHHRLHPAGRLARWQEAGCPVLLHGELAPRLLPVPGPPSELG